MDHTQSHGSITKHMWNAAHALISSQNRLIYQIVGNGGTFYGFWRGKSSILIKTLNYAE